MIGNWYSARIVYDKVKENGDKKPVKENYLVKALTFGEAERIIIDEMKPFISGSFAVTKLQLEVYQEIFRNDAEWADKWFRAKVGFVTIDEAKGKEKMNYSMMLVQSDSTDNALKALHGGMKGTLSDYRVKSISETDYMDIYDYTLEAETEETR